MNTDIFILEKVARSLTENAWGQEKLDPQKLKLGVDLGTAFTVLVALDENDRPLAAEMEFAQFIRDGLVVDYIGCCRLVKTLKLRLEERLGVELERAAIAVPPGTGERDAATHRYVVESSGLEVTAILDEPTAANSVLGITNGAVVDIGGGTTGISIFEGGRVVASYDEPTGGTHMTLVIAGNRGISFLEAEALKRDMTRRKEIFPILVPVMEKMGTIVRNCIKGRGVKEIYLVGGTCCLDGIEEVIAREVGCAVKKPPFPLFTTPCGIAMNCRHFS